MNIGFVTFFQVESEISYIFNVKCVSNVELKVNELINPRMKVLLKSKYIEGSPLKNEAPVKLTATVKFITPFDALNRIYVVGLSSIRSIKSTGRSPGKTFPVFTVIEDLSYSYSNSIKFLASKASVFSRV